MPRNKVKLALVATLLLASVEMASAEATPRPGKLDGRITYISFQEGQVYRVNTRMHNVTVIELGDGERIRNISGGDTASFEPGNLGRSNAFTIKPKIPGQRTNFVVETNRHFYFLEVAESSRVRPFYSVKFSVPGSSRQRTQPQIPGGQPMSYAISQTTKGADFRPSRVWDDGKRTIFEFPPTAPIPSIFRANVKGEEFTVNTSARGTRVTVSTRSERWVLRVGDEYVCVSAREAGNG
ncbi:TrbG/VirB9 family P-type conjugative transfer protein [uncultured Tateyamaria sp.]|uniref:TrbG/VirB9 family P-type conjugative transfer protein n=1 Tax=uncultured Tateyamaria sp. TaxID=455651 RepID=UPI0026272726|nr:TrbG/VirB9 family P-type conjugative transfer protein [uncultured Tateyamaria sp.]